MGIYDEYRDGISTITLGGDRAKAAQFIPQARKMAEVIQGKLDLGTNLGMDYKDSVQLDENTIMRIELSPGVTNKTMKMEIISSVPKPRGVGKTVKTQAESRCAVLPLSRPDARMFTHLFGHDVSGIHLPFNTFEQSDVETTQTPYISPSLEQGTYCSSGSFPGTGDLLFHKEVRLRERFLLMGIPAVTLYVHDGWIGILSPNVFLSFSASVMAKNAPCSMDFPGDPVFTPNPESLGPGNNFAVCMRKNAGIGCDKAFGFNVHLVEGEVFIFFDETQEENEFKTDEGEEATEGDAPAEANPSEGETRRFAAISWTLPDAVGIPADREIVFLYKSDLCPAAVGFFYGGRDGLFPWEYNRLVHFLAPLMCKFPKPGLGPPPAVENTVPPAESPYFIHKERQGLAWVGGEATLKTRFTDKADVHLNSRSFWFELDSLGFPSGRGVHNGPLNSTGGQAGASDGDLGFRFGT